MNSTEELDVPKVHCEVISDEVVADKPEVHLSNSHFEAHEELERSGDTEVQDIEAADGTFLVTLQGSGAFSAAARNTNEIVELFDVALPLCATQILRNLSGVLTTVFVGRMMKTETFATVATGLTFTNLTALSLGAGIASALDTISSQEHGRNNRSLLQGIFLQRSIVATFLVYIPIAVLYSFCSPLMRLMVSHEFADDVVIFLRLSVFIVVPMLITTNILKYAQGQCHSRIGLVPSIVSIGVLLPMLVLFINYLEWDIVGVVVAIGVSRWVMLGLVLWECCNQAELVSTWPGWHLREALETRKLFEFLQMGLPSLVANCADTWGFETMSIIAAHIGPIESSTWSIIMSIYSVLFSPFVGLATASCIKIGNSLGAGDAAKAIRFAQSMWLLTGILGFCCVLLLFLFAGHLFRLYDSDPAVVEMGTTLAPLASVTILFDVLFYVQQGAFRGCAEQKTSAKIVAFSMWIIAVPAAFFLSNGFGIAGILAGLTCGVAVGCPAQAAYLRFGVDWAQAATTASRGRMERVANTEDDVDTVDENNDPIEGVARVACHGVASDNDSELSL